MRRNDNESQSGGNPLAPYAPPVYTMPAGVYGNASTVPVLPPGARNLPTFLGLLNALKRRWVLASFLGLLAGLAAAAGVWLAFPTGKHQVRALMEVQPLAQVLNQQAFDNNFENFKKNQETLIKLRPLLQKVAKSPEVAELTVIRNNDDPAKWIEDQIKLGWESDIMVVKMNGDNPEMLRVILDRLTKEFIADSTLAQRGGLQSRKALLTQTRDELKEKILAHERFIHNLNASGGAVPGGGTEAIMTRLAQQLSHYDQERHSYQTTLTETESKLRTAQNKAKNVDTQPVDFSAVEPELSKSPNLIILQQELAERMKEYATLSERYTDKSRLAPKQREIDELKKNLSEAVSREQAKIETRIRNESKIKAAAQIELFQETIAATNAKLSTVTGLISNLDDRIVKLGKDGIQADLDLRELTPLKEKYHAITSQITDLELMMKSPSRIIPREDATIIYNHNQRQKMMFAGIVAVVAFIAIMVLVSYLEWRSRRVDGVEQVVNELGMRIIGTIPAFPTRASLKAGEADQNQNWRFILNESVNSTRTMLLHTAKSQSMQVIMVTSAMQGEGKTSLASQLGTSMATAGLRTLILDCDLRNPSMHRLFDVQLTPGCSEILCQEADVSDAVQPTSVPNLWMIPAGQCSNRVIAALAQGHPLETLFNRLRGQFDFVVVDSCPVLPVADALLVGQHVDGVVISVLQDISQLPKVMNASERLTQLNIPLLGAVVNGIKTDVHAYGYNYVKQLPA